MRSHTLLTALAVAAFSAAIGAEEVRFNRDILPILSDTCFTCHGPDSATREAGLRFDVEERAKATGENGAAIVPGDPDRSLLISRIHSTERDEVMPPPDSVRKLSAADKALLRRWIEEGAKWEKHWSFLPPERPALPAVKQPEWVRNGIDSFILARLDAEGLAPSPEAPKETLIRRVTLDLTGLPPTPEEVDAFLADERPDAYERLVDRLLASPRYGETMALPWLDAARFADTDGYQYDGPRYMWRWRDWVIDAYNAHMPFDQFTIEQLAGDLLPNPTLEQHLATGFNRNHRYNSESGAVVEEFLLENAVDRVDTASTVWLGLTMGCARCHDHKYDPLSTKDYYQLIAFFNSIPEAGRAIKAGNSEPYIPAPTKAQQAELAKLQQQLVRARSTLETKRMLTRQRAWEADVAAGLAKIAVGLSQRSLKQVFPLDTLPGDAKATQGTVRHTEGVFGTALALDGKSTVSIPNMVGGGKGKKKTARFPAFRANDAYSITFWMRSDGPGKGAVVVRQNKDQSRKGFAVQFRDGHLQFHVVSRWIAGAGVVETLERVEAGKWIHVAVTCDGSQRATRQHIYLDGQKVPVRVIHNTNSNVGGTPEGEPLLIGGSPFATNFTGAVDDLRVYTRELRPEEIFALSEPVYASEIAKRPPGERTARQEAKLSAWFREHGPGKKESDAWLKALGARDAYLKKLPTSMVMIENPEPKPTFIRKRGVYDDHGERVERGVPEQLPVMAKDLPRNRLGLAKWLVSGDNPLTARVTVNRYWQKYFGFGIVKTSEDFGAQGEAPVHPELLDWLATEFVRRGWDVAGMQKLIVTSATYRQSAKITPEGLQRDPDNRLLARGPRIRLPGPVIRDQALFASGLLVEKVGGPSVSPYQPANLWAEMSMGTKYKLGKGEDLFRRSLYTVWKRTVNPPSMAVLDAADRESCWVGVKRTNTPLQALTLLNETAFVESARQLAARMMHEGGDDPIGFAFRTVTARQPSEQERSILTEALAEYRTTYKAAPEDAKKLIATGSSPVPKDLDPTELAAHTTVANIILNLDEVITKE